MTCIYISLVSYSIDLVSKHQYAKQPRMHKHPRPASCEMVFDLLSFYYFFCSFIYLFFYFSMDDFLAVNLNPTDLFLTIDTSLLYIYICKDGD